MEELNLKDLFTMFWEKKAQIILIVLIFAIIGIAYSYFLVVPDYKAKTKLVLTQSLEGTEDGAITQADITLNSKLVSTYGELIKTDNILQTVVENINNPEITINSIKNNVSVESVKSTELLEISVKNSNPNYAAIIANEIAKVFCEKVVEIYNINHPKDIIIFSVIGAVVAVGYVLVANMLDNTIKNEQDVEKITGLMVLTTIPDYELENKRGGKRK